MFEQAIQSAHIPSEKKTLSLQKLRDRAGAQVIGYVGLISFKWKHNYRGWALEKWKPVFWRIFALIIEMHLPGLRGILWGKWALTIIFIKSNKDQ